MVKHLPTMPETQVLIPGSRRSPGEGNGNSLVYSCLENPMDGGAPYARVHAVAKSQTRLSDFTFTFHLFSLRTIKHKSDWHTPYWFLTHMNVSVLI